MAKPGIFDLLKMGLEVVASRDLRAPSVGWGSATQAKAPRPDLDKLRGALPEIDLDPEQSMAALKFLAMAICADGEVAESEKDLLRAPGDEGGQFELEGVGPVDLDALLDEAADTLSKPEDEILAALKAIAAPLHTKELREPIFVRLHALLVLDGLTSEEVDFSHLAAAALDISDLRRVKLIEIASAHVRGASNA